MCIPLWPHNLGLGKKWFHEGYFVKNCHQSWQSCLSIREKFAKFGSCHLISLFFKNAGELLSQHNIVHISFLHVISKFFEIVDHLTRNNLLKDKQYEFYFFLSGRSIKIVLNSHSSVAQEFNVGIFQGSPRSHTLFLLFINNLFWHILRLLVKISADDTNAYGQILKNQGD